MKPSRIPKWAALLLALAAQAQNPSAPAAAAAPKPAGDQTTVITSDRLTYDYNKAYALFQDHVVVVDPSLKLTSDELEVKFDEKGDVAFLQARGQVFIQQAEKTARAELASYFVKEGKIVLEKNPQVMQGGKILQGGRITFWRMQNRMEVDQGTQMIIPNSDREDAAIPGFDSPSRPKPRTP
jgi:lipopolysaccharide transport protein LptA